MDLSKAIIEGFDVKVIRARLADMSIAFGKDEGSLMLIEKILASGAIDPQRLSGLRTVQLIRTKVKGHVGSSEAVELAKDALTRHETFSAHFEHVCKLVGDELSRIEHALS